MTYLIGHVIADEAIEQAIRRQLADVAARITAGTLTEYLAQALLNADPVRRATFASWMIASVDQNETYPPEVSFQFRREPVVMPCIVVRLASENDGQFVGETAGLVTLGGGTDQRQELRGETWRAAVEVIVESYNSDRCRYLYQLLKFWLGQERVTLAQRAFGGFLELSMVGRDLEHVRELEHAGRFVYRRGLQVTSTIHQTDAINTRSQITDADTAVGEVGSGIVPRYDVPA